MIKESQELSEFVSAQDEKNLRVGDLEGDWVGNGVGDFEGLVLGPEVGLEVIGVDGDKLGDFEGFRDGDNVGCFYKEDKPIV